MTDETTNILLDEFRTMRKDVREDVQGLHMRINEVKESVVKLDTEVSSLKETSLSANRDVDSLERDFLRCQGERTAVESQLGSQLEALGKRVERLSDAPAPFIDDSSVLERLNGSKKYITHGGAAGAGAGLLYLLYLLIQLIQGGAA